MPACSEVGRRRSFPHLVLMGADCVPGTGSPLQARQPTGQARPLPSRNYGAARGSQDVVVPGVLKVELNQRYQGRVDGKREGSDESSGALGQELGVQKASHTALDFGETQTLARKPPKRSVLVR